MTRTLGVIGGMGPAATIDFQRRVLDATPAHADHEHLHLIVDNNPHVPSRIAALIDGAGEDPTPILIRMAQGLVRAGADALVMPCNSAHVYAGAIAEAVDVPFLNMITETTRRIARQNVTSIGLIASTAVVRSGLYAQACRANGIACIEPDASAQAGIMRLIVDVKAGRAGPESIRRLLAIGASLAARDAAAILVACTDLSTLSPAWDVPAFDASQVLAEAAVAFALQKQTA